MVVRVVPVTRITDADVGAWAALEASAIEPNAYLSPHFVLPAARHLEPGREVLVFLVERPNGSAADLSAVAVLTTARPSWRCPMRRLVDFQSKHSFLGGLLLDRACAERALHTLLHFLRREFPRFKTLQFSQVWHDGMLAHHATPGGSSALYQPRVIGVQSRAVLVPAHAKDILRNKSVATKVKDCRRRQRRLSEIGPVEWRFHRHAGIPAEATESFLALEHMGWKGSEGTSLRSSAAQEAFFREMIAGFASERRAVFTELTLGGKVIASTCNLISGTAGFAFKIGWDPEYKRYSPALLNELELMLQADTLLSDLQFVDSGAEPDSYINELWPERRQLQSLCFPTQPSGAVLTHLLNCLRTLRNEAQRLRQAAARGRPAHVT